MSALSVAETISDPCARRRHHACQLGDACACLCHTPEGLPVARPLIEECASLSDAVRLWMQAIQGSYIIRDESRALVAYMRARAHPVLLGWLDDHAELLVARIVNNDGKSGAIRMGRDPMSPRSVFAEAAEAFENGVATSFDFLSIPYVVDKENRRDCLTNLTYGELRFAIESYDKRAKSNAMEAAYLRAVQKRLPKDNSKTVGDVFTNEELAALRKAAE